MGAMTVPSPGRCVLALLVATQLVGCAARLTQGASAGLMWRVGEHAAHPVADGRAIEAAGTLGRPVACGEDHEFALLGGDRLAARLGARPLLDEQEIAPGVVDTADLFGCGHQPAGGNQQEAQEALAQLR